MSQVPLPALPASLADVLELTAADRRAVDDLIRKRLSSEIVLVNQISHYIIGGGGKRMRPLVHLLAARAAGYPGRDHLQVAAIIEFIHTATLLHDDVVDESGQRRGKDTAHRVWGNAASVLVGDFLYSRSFQLMVEINRMEVMSILANTTNTIAEGEVLQLMQMGNADLSERDYFRVISDKTACLFAASARLGGVMAGARQELCAALEHFGLLLGQAFQIADDVLDYRADGDALGKSLGDDLAEGKVTLPLILAMERADEPVRQSLRDMIGTGGSRDLAMVCAIMNDTGALDDALARARQLAKQAQACLDELPISPEREALSLLAAYAVDRSL
ncbi:MAG: polyprenyl synthetase family protein [Wenzhouxiangella sp.]|nr:polyprenyl synthetase family protein [Wenzhouxiangella sp.]MCH8476870.1 polyprenyl synthetase family protein [Wenzhouxiangella sp.]TVR94808.1 MAG: octaprenyl-diphosphate synthase [Wenzhouxiangellaceae bacterium]